MEVHVRLLILLLAVLMNSAMSHDILRESEERLRLAFWAANIGFWNWDLVTNEVYLSPIWKSQLGYEDHELPNQFNTWESLLHPDDRESSWKVIHEAQKDPQRLFEMYFRLRHKDQSYRWILSRGRVYRDESGKPVRIMGCHVDVNQQKQDELLIRDANEFNRQIIANAQEGVIVYDLDLRYRLWNPYMEKITGIPESAVLGKRTLEIFPFMKEYGIEDYLRRALAGEFVQGKDLLYHSTVKKKSGWSTGRYGPLRNAQGQTIGVIATVREITERKQIETRLHDHQQRLELIMEQLPSILWTVDRELRITSSMGAGLKAVGMSPNSANGAMLEEILTTPDHPALSAHQQALKGHSVAYDNEFRDRHFIVHVEPLRDQSGAIQGCIGLAQDVTEVKKQEAEQQALERRVQQAQKLESLEVLAGGIAHDFNNLLTGMLGYASLALTELPAGSPVALMVREIEKAAQRAADLSRQMLAYSGKGKFVIEIISLDELVVEMAGLLKTIVTPKGQLHMATDPAVIEGDATQIRQVVMNLITNAADAISSDGLIALRTGVRFCTEEELCHTRIQERLAAGSYAFIEVQDNGVGMTKEVIDRIFDPFFTTKFTGRGLGLASALGIVRGHQGTIAVESEPGKGTTFRVLLPACSQPRISTPQAPAANGPSLDRGTILVIEDDPSVLGFVEFVLRKAGYEVLGTGDSKQSVALFEKHAAQIRAAVVDLTMPQLSGIELAQLLREKHASLPILMMSGYSEEQVAPRFEGIKINGFLKKPFRSVEFTTLLADILHANHDVGIA